MCPKNVDGGGMTSRQLRYRGCRPTLSEDIQSLTMNKQHTPILYGDSSPLPVNVCHFCCCSTPPPPNRAVASHTRVTIMFHHLSMRRERKKTRIYFLYASHLLSSHRSYCAGLIIIHNFVEPRLGRTCQHHTTCGVVLGLCLS